MSGGGSVGLAAVFRIGNDREPGALLVKVRLEAPPTSSSSRQPVANTVSSPAAEPDGEAEQIEVPSTQGGIVLRRVADPIADFFVERPRRDVQAERREDGWPHGSALGSGDRMC